MLSKPDDDGVPTISQLQTPRKNMFCDEIGHNIELRKVRVPLELTMDDWCIIMLLMMMVIGIPFIPIWIWLRRQTKTYEICVRCGTRF